MAYDMNFTKIEGRKPKQPRGKKSIATSYANRISTFLFLELEVLVVSNDGRFKSQTCSNNLLKKKKSSKI
jgi:hypothetical protein